MKFAAVMEVLDSLSVMLLAIGFFFQTRTIGRLQKRLYVLESNAEFSEFFKQINEISNRMIERIRARAQEQEKPPKEEGGKPH